MKHVFLALSVIAILTSCDRDDNFPGQPNPHASIKEFIVPMNFYLEKADVDSAIAKWQTGTTTQTIKLNFRNDT